MNVLRRGALLLVCALQALAASAFAADAERRYAVISLIGDTITVVGSQVQIGSLMDRNTRQSIPVPDATFDRSALVVAAEALKQADAQASPALFMPRNAALFRDHDGFFDGAKATLPAAIGSELRAQGLTHLLLFTKYRSESQLRDANGNNLGTGKLEGLGFYVNSSRKFVQSDTLEHSEGFIAPYVYVRVSLIDLAGASVLQARTVTASRVRAPRYSQGEQTAWETMSAEEKVATLRDLLESEARKVMPAVLKP